MRPSLFLALALVTTGCTGSTPEEVPPPKQTPATSAHSAPSTAPAGSPHGAPAQEPTGQPTKPAPTDEQITALEAAYEKSPANEAAKIALVGALVARADYYMYAPELAPREKYPKALALYRKAAKLDPSNATAKSGIETIEGIYKSMGRPVPEA